MLDWDVLRIILSVHEMKGVTGAARDLNLSQPTVSRHLSRAESSLGTKLFDRRRGRLEATEAGLLVVQEASRISQQMRRMTDKVRSLDNEMAGTITLSVPRHLMGYCLTQDLAAYRALYPNITYSIHASDAITDVNSGAADVVIRIEENPKPSLWGRRIAHVNYAYFAHTALAEQFSIPDHPLTEAQDIPLLAISGGTGEDEVQDLFPNGFVAAQSDSLDCMVAMIQNRMGVGRLPRFIARDLPDIVMIAPTVRHQSRTAWALTHKDLRTVKRIERFIDFLADRAPCN